MFMFHTYLSLLHFCKCFRVMLFTTQPNAKKSNLVIRKGLGMHKPLCVCVCVCVCVRVCVCV